MIEKGDDLLTSFQEACEACIHDNLVWERALTDACVAGTLFQLREMFAYMPINCQVTDPPSLWDQFRDPLVGEHIPNSISQSVAEQKKALAHIQSILKSSNKTHIQYRLPEVEEDLLNASTTEYDYFLWQYV